MNPMAVHVSREMPSPVISRWHVVIFLISIGRPLLPNPIKKTKSSPSIIFFVIILKSQDFSGLEVVDTKIPLIFGSSMTISFHD